MSLWVFKTTKEVFKNYVIHGLVNTCIHMWSCSIMLKNSSLWVFKTTKDVFKNYVIHGLVNTCIHMWSYSIMLKNSSLCIGSLYSGLNNAGNVQTKSSVFRSFTKTRDLSFVTENVFRRRAGEYESSIISIITHYFQWCR